MGVPKRALGGSVAGMDVVPLVCPYDGFGEGGLRGVGERTGEWVFGGGHPDDVEPKVIDTVVPEGTTQSEALAYTADSQATLPYLDVPESDSE